MAPSDEAVKSYKSIFIVWLSLMVLLVGFIIFFDRHGEMLAMRAWEQYPPNAYEVAVKYLGEGRLEDAARMFEASLEFAARPGVRWPDYKLRLAKYRLGEIYYELGQYDKALPFLESLAESAPGLYEGMPVFYLGETYLKRGETRKAARAFRTTTEWNFGATSAIAFVRLGELAAEEGDYGSALDNLDTAIALDAGVALTEQVWKRVGAIARDAVVNTEGSTAALARELLGISQYRRKDFAACVGELEAALEAGRDTPRVRYSLAKAHGALGVDGKAQQHFAQLPSGKVVTQARDMVHTTGRPDGDAWVLNRNGSLREEVFFANRVDRIEVQAKGSVAELVGANMVVKLGGAEVGKVELKERGFKTYMFESSVSGDHGLLEILFTNNYYNPDTGEARRLYVTHVALEYRPDGEKFEATVTESAQQEAAAAN